MSAFEILFTPSAWEKLWAYTDAVTTEIGGLGYMKGHKGYGIVDEVFILPQHRSNGAVDFAEASDPVGACDDAMAWALDKAVRDDRVEDLTFSWHSHGSIAVMWSSTDEEAIAKYKSSGLPYLASTVVNREGKHLSRLDVFQAGLVDHITLKDVKAMQMQTEQDVALMEQVNAEIEALAIEKKWTSTYKKGGGNNGTGNSGDGTKSGKTTSPASTSTRLLGPGTSKTPPASLNGIDFSEAGVGVLYDPKDKSKQPPTPELMAELEAFGYVLMETTDNTIYVWHIEDNLVLA